VIDFSTPFRAAADEAARCALGRRFAAGLTDAGFQVGNDVVLNQVLVSFGTDDGTDAVIGAVQRDGTCWMGGTIWHGRRYMRISRPAPTEFRHARVTPGCCAGMSDEGDEVRSAGGSRL
jgi:hypothetical protein